MNESLPSKPGLTLTAHIERLRKGLARPGIIAQTQPAVQAKAAAVLVPIFVQQGDLNLLYIRRSDHVASHRGQVAFPGGRYELSDGDLLRAALREAREEVNIDPDSVEVLGGFPTMSTMATGIAVSPFIGMIPSIEGLRPDPSEVAEIFHVPLAALRDDKYHGEFQWQREGGPTSSYPAILYGGQTIWGLTLRITQALLELLD